LATNVGSASLSVRVGIPEHKEQLQSLLSKFRLSGFQVALKHFASRFASVLISPPADITASMRRVAQAAAPEMQLLPLRRIQINFTLTKKQAPAFALRLVQNSTFCIQTIDLT
jgi:hypothetical protein